MYFNTYASYNIPPLMNDMLNFEHSFDDKRNHLNRQPKGYQKREPKRLVGYSKNTHRILVTKRPELFLNTT